MILAYTVSGIGFVIAVFGLVALANPGLTRGKLHGLKRSGVAYAAGVVRMAMGAIFVLGSEQCSWPAAIMWLGILLLATGIIALLVGEERLETMISWFAAQSDGVFRLWGAVGIAFGGFVIRAAL